MTATEKASPPQVLPLPLPASATMFRNIGGFFADNLLRSRVTLKVTPTENEALTEDIKTSAPHAVHLQPGVCNLIVHYDTKLGSEANSIPASRKAPLRDVHLKSCIAAARKALPPKGPGTSLRPADVYVFQDQGR
ncbi:MAG: hypothetical protein ACKPKO_07295, partial [Candidatus Fonsibacter sp.]